MDCGQFILVGAAKTTPAFQLNGTSLSSPPSVNPAPPATADPASLSGSPILTDFQKFGQKKATDPATLSRRRLSIPVRILFLFTDQTHPFISHVSSKMIFHSNIKHRCFHEGVS